MEGVTITKQLSQPLLRLHKIAYKSHEDAIKALFSRDISLAEAIRNKRETVATLFHKIETIAHAQPIEFAPYILAASSMVRIYDHSVDIADLGMPRPLRTSAP